MSAIAVAQYRNAMSFGYGEAARFISAKQAEGLRELVESSLGMGGKGVISELESIAAECRFANWDGHGAAPLARESYVAARNVLESLPLGSPPPSIGASPLGLITLEWYKSKHRILTVIVDASGELHFAALLGPAKIFGREPFFGDVPVSILRLISQVLT